MLSLVSADIHQQPDYRSTYGASHLLADSAVRVSCILGGGIITGLHLFDKAALTGRIHSILLFVAMSSAFQLTLRIRWRTRCSNPFFYSA